MEMMLYLQLPPPLEFVSERIADPKALDTFRVNYQKFRCGGAQGAKGEVQQLLVSVHQTSEEKYEAEEKAYELAKDVRIDPMIDEGRFISAFERSKRMRSVVVVETGIVDALAARALDVIPRKCHRSSIYVVTDSVTDALYGDVVLDGLLGAGLGASKLVIPSETDASGENSTEMHKSLTTFSNLADQILAGGVDKRSCIVSLGGGVVNNICGYLASSIYRGLALVHVSTTFMGQVDAAIDFKQAVNHCANRIQSRTAPLVWGLLFFFTTAGCGKNLLGSYYPAATVVLDPSLLTTQSTRHRRNGLAEAAKHGMVHSTDLLDYIRAGNIDDPAYLDGVVRRTISVKVPTLTRYDESDFNEMAPQYGHAPAHAVEFLSWHGACNEPLLHGEAVAIGMCVSAEVAFIMGVCAESVVEEHYAIVEALGLPSCVPPELDLDKVIDKLSYDKHTLSGKPTMGLLVKMGKMYEKDGVYGQPVDADILREAFEINQDRAAK
ncbi:hypothetical protein CTAYLR_007404 [Chrysophaeum taylorii]|uniref:3-dehydroquinate synthase domain-containing protein n=1 Tax=Chrysophaeum taylorii TaxID=2483200 RepID=A0AAD7XH97_9STRA|nr:hypothetical protein CTAYLR_007404 [Chrysophaeum taylorii]